MVDLGIVETLQSPGQDAFDLDCQKLWILRYSPQRKNLVLLFIFVQVLSKMKDPKKMRGVLICTPNMFICHRKHTGKYDWSPTFGFHIYFNLLTTFTYLLISNKDFDIRANICVPNTISHPPQVNVEVKGRFDGF